MRNEFQMIINLTDQDQEHKKKLKQLDSKLCRYKDIYPYEYNVIKINNSHENVNASMMNIITEGSFIASQGPNDNTVDDFWQMCFQYNVGYILMLCKEFEDNKKKCSNYWDNNMVSTNFQNTGFQLTYQDNFIERKQIMIHNKITNESRLFHHLQFKHWPDHATPNIQNYVKLFTQMFQFVDEGRELKNKNINNNNINNNSNNNINNNINNNSNNNINSNNNNQIPNGPILIHCSAGIGRTGVFLTLYALCKEITNQLRSQDSDCIIFSVYNFVRKLKEMRMFSVENINQYNFIYKFLEEYLREVNTPQQPQMSS